MNSPAFTGHARRNCVVTFEYTPGTLHLQGTARRIDEPNCSVTLRLVSGETRRGLGDRLEAALALQPCAASFDSSHLSIGANVQPTRAWRDRMGIDQVDEQGRPTFCRIDNAPFPRDFRGRLVALERTDRGIFAHVRHKPEDCGCDFADNAVCRGGYRCRRCGGTGMARLRFFRVDDLEVTT